MKQQKINPATLNPMEMNNMSSMMSMMSLIQKIGKGKRKYGVNLDKSEKKFFGKFLVEAKKQFPANEPQLKPVVEFFDYAIKTCESKQPLELRMSFEELEFTKKMLSDSIKGMDTITFKWYDFFRKSMMKVMGKQYRAILKKIN